MSRRKDPIPGYLVLAIVALALITVAIPFVWLWLEISRRKISTLTPRFAPTKEEREKAVQTKTLFDAAQTAEKQVISKALGDGCVYRQDGLFDERRRIATECNKAILYARETAALATDGFESAVSAADSRFKEWASTMQYLWALRVLLVSTLVAWLAGIGKAEPDYIAWAERIYCGGFPAGAIALGITWLWTRTYRPRDPLITQTIHTYSYSAP